MCSASSTVLFKRILSGTSPFILMNSLHFTSLDITQTESSEIAAKNKVNGLNKEWFKMRPTTAKTSLQKSN